MFKKKMSSISINVMSAFVILMCLFMAIVNPANAWFTDSHKQGVQIEVDVGDLKLKVYQNSISDANEILTNAVNSIYETDKNPNGANNTSTNPQYISLSGEIAPDTTVGLKLILANKDLGSASMYVRYKLEIYARGFVTDTLLENVEITGFDAAEDGVPGFVKNATDGYYYYQNYSSNAQFSNENNALFTKNEDAVMLTHFEVPYDDFVISTTDGGLKLVNSDTVYIKLIVQASVNKQFTDFAQ